MTLGRPPEGFHSIPPFTKHDDFFRCARCGSLVLLIDTDVHNGALHAGEA